MRHILLAMAFVVAGSAVLAGEVDPHTAHVEWADGKSEDVYVVNLAYCERIEALVRGGVWRPAQRDGIAISRVTCRRGGPIPGGSCIKGYQGPRAEGYCR